LFAAIVSQSSEERKFQKQYRYLAHFFPIRCLYLQENAQMNLLGISCLLALLLAVTLGQSVHAAPPADPVFDLDAIMHDPVEAVVLDKAVENGVVFETIEFTSRVVDGKPERIKGIYAFPDGGQALPAVFWSMGGMAPANRSFPEIFARKGYACLAITLPHALRNSYRIPFNAAHPATANMTLLARDQLRGITVLSQRPEVDPERIAVAGASYGGVFATLIAGVDPRIKAGFSFFGGGDHALGTTLPQFQSMKTLDDVAIWNRTFDGAFRLKTRSIPFMWGVAFNDHWFMFPAVTQTFMDAAGTDKRMAILPYWQHGFPPNIDQALIDFLDTSLTHTRSAYNAPGPLKVYEDHGKTVAEFAWTGANAVAKAEIVVSYGEPAPWLGWTQRACFVFPATIENGRATAQVPIPSRALPLVAWGNLTDNNAVVTSTPPLALDRDALAALPVDKGVELNAFIDGNLGDDVLDLYRRHNEPLGGEPDRQVKHSGDQSLRFSPPKAGEKAANALTIHRFFNVPGLAHRFSVWVRAEEPTALTVTLTPVRPPSWRSPLVRQIIAGDPRLAPLVPKWNEPVVPLTATATAGPDWREITLDVPAPDAPVEGYSLDIRPAAETGATWWVDTIRMQPVWPE